MYMCSTNYSLLYKNATYESSRPWVMHALHTPSYIYACGTTVHAADTYMCALFHIFV